MSIPRDLAIVGFDDIDLASTKAYDLTTYRQPSQQMVDELIDMIMGRKPARSTALKAGGAFNHLTLIGCEAPQDGSGAVLMT
jgi:DNA-binding LacI/PurR family transcriptional regulator